MATISEVWTAYEQARGRWSGCDWPTRFGSLGIDLEGVSSVQARGAARRWRALAGEACGEATAQENTTLAGMALHLRLRCGAVWVGEDGRTPPRLAPRPTRRHCAEALAQEWEAAACVLGEIESDASRAEREGWDAVRSAERGDWDRALWHAGQASALESGYHALRLWGRLRRLIEAAAGPPRPPQQVRPLSDLH
jgi:hypothetical protein